MVLVNKLYYGDNLDVLREHVPSGSVDLVYLDPPFNSNATYNVLFRAPTGEQSRAQIEAFEDTWHWNETAEDAYWQVLNGAGTEAAAMLTAMRGFLGENDMMAYLAMMAVRLIELHRVLKPTGSLYLHCDPTASHYLKIMLDAIFGATQFKNEIVWKRQSAHSDARHKFPDVSDAILLFGRSQKALFKAQFTAHDPAYLEKFYRFDDQNGRGPYRLDNMTSPNPRPNMMYEWQGFPCPAKGWRYQRETMQRLHDEGRIHYPRRQDAELDTTRRPALKRYFQEQRGSIVTSVWTDVTPLHSSHSERLGYPTQKPVALLERIIAASSNEGDLVLDPFCGCGTTIHAAQKLKRRWIGIDVTHLAIALIERRLREAFPGVGYEAIGVPKDFGSAEALAARDKHEFQKWAITLIPDAQPWRGGRKGADTGIDGIVYLRTAKARTDKAIIEVKGGEKVGVDVVHKLKSVVEREKALVGMLIALREPSQQARVEATSAGFSEIDMGTGTARFPRIQILTVEGLLSGAEHPRLPIVDSTLFRKARREESRGQGDLGV